MKKWIRYLIYGLILECLLEVAVVEVGHCDYRISAFFQVWCGFMYAMFTLLKRDSCTDMVRHKGFWQRAAIHHHNVRISQEVEFVDWRHNRCCVYRWYFRFQTCVIRLTRHSCVFQFKNEISQRLAQRDPCRYVAYYCNAAYGVCALGLPSKFFKPFTLNKKRKLPLKETDDSRQSPYANL